MDLTVAARAEAIVCSLGDLRTELQQVRDVVQSTSFQLADRLRSVTERVARAADYARLAASQRITSQLASDRVVEQTRAADKAAAVARAVSAATQERDEAASRRADANTASRAALVTILGETKKRLGAIRFTSRLVRAGAVGLRTALGLEIGQATQVLNDVIAAASIRSRDAFTASTAAVSLLTNDAREVAAAELVSVKMAVGEAQAACITATDSLCKAQSEARALRAIVHSLDTIPVRVNVSLRPAPIVGFGKRSRAEALHPFVPLKIQSPLNTALQTNIGYLVCGPASGLASSVLDSRTSRTYACLSLSAVQPFGMRDT